MDRGSKTAIVLGATGLTGGALLQLLLEDPRYAEIRVFSRRGTGHNHPKLREFLGSLLDLSAFKEHFLGSEIFCCIGTTRAKTPDKAEYRKIDYGIPVQAAQLAATNGIPGFLVVSSLGANPGSRIFYSRTKGEMEVAVAGCNLRKTHILRPSLLVGERKEKRPMEWVAGLIMKGFRRLLAGPLEKYKPVTPGQLARCMHWLANHPYEKLLISSDEIRRIAAAYKG